MDCGGCRRGGCGGCRRGDCGGCRRGLWRVQGLTALSPQLARAVPATCSGCPTTFQGRLRPEMLRDASPVRPRRSIVLGGLLSTLVLSTCSPRLQGARFSSSCSRRGSRRRRPCSKGRAALADGSARRCVGDRVRVKGGLEVLVDLRSRPPRARTSSCSSPANPGLPRRRSCSSGEDGAALLLPPGSPLAENLRGTAGSALILVGGSDAIPAVLEANGASAGAEPPPPPARSRRRPPARAVSAPPAATPPPAPRRDGSSTATSLPPRRLRPVPAVIRRYDAIIVGGGPAGLSAALILGRAGGASSSCDTGRPRNAASGLCTDSFLGTGYRRARSSVRRA